MIATLTKDVPKTAISAIQPMFEHLCASAQTESGKSSWAHLQPPAFDWAIHPGGAAILEGAQQSLHLTGDHIRASLDVYHNYGNSSSPTVIVVLDKLRHIGRGRDNIVATSFGPGMMIEMCVLKRCRQFDLVAPFDPKLGKKYQLCLALRSSFATLLKRPATLHRVAQGKHEIEPILLQTRLDGSC